MQKVFWSRQFVDVHICGQKFGCLGSYKHPLRIVQSTIVKQHTAAASYAMEHTGSVLVWLPRPSHLRGRVWYH